MIYLYFTAFYFLISWSILQNLLLITLFLVAAFTLRFGALWLVPLAILVDGYFGAFSAVPMFSFIAVGWYIVSELLRPYVRVS